jgi:hypothetical protein
VLERALDVEDGVERDDVEEIVLEIEVEEE